MKLLVDENLSPRLAAAFQAEYPGSTHADYHERSLIGGYPPKVIWVRRGNASTAEIEAILRSHREAIERLDAEAELAVLIL